MEKGGGVVDIPQRAFGGVLQGGSLRLGRLKGCRFWQKPLKISENRVSIETTFRETGATLFVFSRTIECVGPAIRLDSAII